MWETNSFKLMGKHVRDYCSRTLLCTFITSVSKIVWFQMDLWFCVQSDFLYIQYSLYLCLYLIYFVRELLMCFYHLVFYCCCQILKNWSQWYAAAIKYQLVAEYHLNLLKCDSSAAKFIHRPCAGPGIIHQGRKMQTPVGRAAQLNSGRVVNSCLHWSQKGAAVPLLFFSYIFVSVAAGAGAGTREQAELLWS